MTVFDVISLLGGLALFLYGMRIMGDGLKSGSSDAMKRVMGHVTGNPFLGFLLGLLVTGIIQSSTATIVLTSGLVGAGILTLHQSLGIILGANVGTTVTGQIIRLLDIDGGSASILQLFKPSTLAPVAAIIGIIFIMVIKMKNADTIGTIAIGFGILFTGLLNMTAAVEPLSESETFAQLFVSLADKPFLGFLAGTGVALLIQSSSASVGILQALSVTGQLSLGSIWAIILGIYMGDCITTAIVCSIGAKPDARRTGIVHVMFNASGVVLVFAVLMVLRNFTSVLDNLWGDAISSGGIANVHTIFKLGSALVLLPVCTLFEKISTKIIKDVPASKSEQTLQHALDNLDPNLYSSPALALGAAQRSISTMAELAHYGVDRALEILADYDAGAIKELEEHESTIDAITDHTSLYLIGLSPHMKTGDRNNQLNFYMKCISEFERIGDHAINLTENAKELKDKEFEFSAEARKELTVVYEALNEVMDDATAAFAKDDMDAARRVEPVEEVIDDIVAKLRSNHLRRLVEGTCNPIQGIIFSDILVNVERISDQCSNIAVYALGMHDEQIAVQEHEYIHKLHQGISEEYNKRYAERSAYYMGKLN